MTIKKNLLLLLISLFPVMLQGQPTSLHTVNRKHICKSRKHLTCKSHRQYTFKSSTPRSSFQHSFCNGYSWQQMNTDEESYWGGKVGINLPQTLIISVYKGYQF